MRVRSRGSFSTGTPIISWSLATSCATAGTWSNVGSVECLETGESELMVDVVVPQFRRKVAEGQVFFNPMVKTRRSYALTGNGFHMRSTSPSCPNPLRYDEFKREGPMVQQFVPTYFNPETGKYRLRVDRLIKESEVSKLITEASTAALADVGRSTHNGWETLAEAKKSMGMLNQALSQANGILFNKGIARRAKEQGNAWLLWRYGIRPLLRAMEEATKALEDLAGTVRKTDRSVLSLSRDSQEVQSNVHGNLITNVLVTKTHHVSVRAAVLSETTKNVQSALGLTAMDAMDLPWELVKYSFVSDWFLNIGDRLSALAPLVGVKLLGSCVTVHHVYTATYSAIGTTCFNGANTVLRPVTGSCTGLIDEKYREPLGTPGIVVKTDFLGQSPLARIADAASLLGQRLI